MREHRGRLILGVLSVFGRSTLALAGPWYLGKGMDQIIARAGRPAVSETVWLLLLFALGTSLCQLWMRLLLIGWSRIGEERLRGATFGNLMGLAPTWFDRARTGDLLSRLTSDIEAVRMGFGPGLMHMLQPIVMTVGAVVLMTMKSQTLTLVAVVPLFGLFLVMRLLLPRIHDHAMKVQERQADLSALAQETFSGARVIQAFAREENEEARFGGRSEKVRAQSLMLARSRALFSCLIELSSNTLTLVVLLAGGWLVLYRDLTVGTYVAFNDYLRLLIWPMIAMGWTLGLFKRAEASDARVREVRELEPQIRGGRARVPAPQPLALSVRQLTFAYEGSKAPALQEVSFDLPRGGTLGIVGTTGAGKSTVARLLARLYDPPPGSVLVDGLDVREWPLDALRARIAVVPQDGFLFSDTIRANLLFGVREVSEARLQRAIDLACLQEAIDSFPDGLDTMLGERGVTLSGGQRQRVAIARALLVDAPILVFDDASSAVDTETEQMILRGLKAVFEEKTTVVISHRVSAVMRADLIVVLEGGRITERGKHEELLARKGHYAHIHRLQQARDELERLG